MVEADAGAVHGRSQQGWRQQVRLVRRQAAVIADPGTDRALAEIAARFRRSGRSGAVVDVSVVRRVPVPRAAAGPEAAARLDDIERGCRLGRDIHAA
jgi:hypothetical protein